ncbi:hypothetical protein K501DRAFT_329381 [Backusella circina FSU 941]|nr:hypothetical protein K501DRAFT_329381 [Backusella circina FSU 941]
MASHDKVLIFYTKMNPNSDYTAEQQYYQQWGYYYNTTQPIPQGDPSNALSSMVYQLQQQTQQRQALGALAAASVTSALGNNTERNIISYNDISTPQQNSSKVCCHRWLKSATAIAQHEKLHIKCPSCDFMCLKSVLSDHEEVVHGIPSGKEKKSRPDGIAPPNAPKINTPEELASWIEARKKNWPSKMNIERKQQEEAEKRARGEISIHEKRKNTEDHNSSQKRLKTTANENTLVAAAYNSDSDSDDVMDPERDAVTSKDPTSIGHLSLPVEHTRKKRVCKYFLKGKCDKGDQCKFLHEKPPPKSKQQTTHKKSSLLFKLLEKEMKQEKSVILQCLRYIADNDFLGQGNTL